jgi:hypothetical protein
MQVTRRNEIRFEQISARTLSSSNSGALVTTLLLFLRPPPLRTQLQQVPVAGADLEALEVFTMSLYNEVNPLAVQHTKLAIKPNRSKWDTLLLDVLPKSVPHSKAAAKLQGLLRGARERRRAEPPGWYRKLNAETRALARRVAAAVGEETRLDSQTLARSAATDGKMVNTDDEPEWLKRAGSILGSQDTPPPNDKMRAVEKPTTVAPARAGAQAVANRQAETREDAAARGQARTLAKWLAEKEADAAAKAEAEADAAARVEAQVLASVVAATRAEAQAFARLATEAEAEVASAARAEARALAISASASATASKIARLAAAAAAEAEAAASAEAHAFARRQAAAEALALGPANLSLMTDDERPDLGEWQRRMLEAREASCLPLDYLRDHLSLMRAVGAVIVAVAVAVCLMLRKCSVSVKERMAKFEKSDPTWHVVLLPTSVGSRGSVQSVAPKGPRGPRPLLNSAEAVRQLLLSISLLTMSAAPNVTADYQSLPPDAKPALGRGYSLTTHDVFSTCLDFTEKPMPTQSYSQTMLEFTHDGKCSSDSITSMEGSASWGFVRSTIEASVSAKPEVHSKKHYVATRRPAELSSSTIDERTATLTQDALALVERGDLVGFFQACGTGFIRSIRRRTELAAVFEFSSSSVQTSQEMAAFFKDGGASRSTISMSNDSNTTIKVKGFGLILNPEGADTLVAHNFEDYNNAVKFATSTQSEGVNMVYAVEVVSWANNLQFKNAVNFRTQELVQYEAGPDGTDVCNVVRKDNGQPMMVEAVEIKSMTMINAEYITGLDAIYHKEMDAVLKFIACQGELSAMIDIGRGDSKLLDHSSNHLGMSAQTKAESVTVAEAERILSPRQLEVRKDSLEAFVEHFYGKCATQMTKHSDAGGMVKYWWDFDECMPAANGTQHFSLECLDAGRSFEHDGNQLTCPVRQAIYQKPYGIDHFLEKFCMPQVDSSVLNG